MKSGLKVTQVVAKSWRYPLSPLLQLRRNPSKDAVNAIVGPLADGKHWVPHTLKALGEEKRADLVSMVFEILQGSPKANLDARDYTIAISACSKARSWQRACELLAAMSLYKVERSVISYSAAISSCEKGAQWLHALSLLESMPKAGHGFLKLPHR